MCCEAKTIPLSETRGCLEDHTVKLFLAGDVMLGRGVDQLLPSPCDPQLYESHASSALEYVRLAERRSGTIARPVSFDYVWGEGIVELRRQRPDTSLINLETAISRSDAAEQKGINYRMSPENVEVLAAADIQACMLANNHVMDWGEQGLLDTLRSLHTIGIAAAGAGQNQAEASAPLVLDVAGKGRVIVVAFGCPTSGVPTSWQATTEKPGVNVLSEPPSRWVREVSSAIKSNKRPGDIAVASLHWGGNWGYTIPRRQRQLAHALIDEASIDIVFGHSSHHAKAIEVYGDKLILYGCGDLINDYEGISGHDEFRGDLALMYFPTIATARGKLLGLEMAVFRIRSMRLEHANEADTRWLVNTLGQQCAEFGTCLVLGPDGTIHLNWK